MIRIHPESHLNHILITLHKSIFDNLLQEKRLRQVCTGLWKFPPPLTIRTVVGVFRENGAVLWITVAGIQKPGFTLTSGFSIVPPAPL